MESSDSDLYNWTPRPLPDLKTFTGQFIRLEPVDISKHLSGLADIQIHAPDAPERFKYLYRPQPKSEKDLIDFIQSDYGKFLYIIIDSASEKVVGNICLFDIDQKNGSVEIGLYYSESISKKSGGTEAVFLALKHVFDDLKYRRLVWTADNRHDGSKNAAIRYGFVYEAVFRQESITKSEVIDNLWYSMIDKDWPFVKAAIEKWLATENFDETGMQKERLNKIRKSLGVPITTMVEPPPPVIPIEESFKIAKTIDVSRWAPRNRPPRHTFEGQYVRLEPLDIAKHGDALFEACTGPDAERLFRYTLAYPPKSREEFQSWLEKAQSSEDPLYFVVIDKATGKDLRTFLNDKNGSVEIEITPERVAGRQTFLRIEENNGSIEIGHVLWTSLVARKPAATEALYLFAKHVFEDLGYRRFEWKCNNLNEASKNAALRFGFKYEGVWRQHRIAKCANRDTAWFAMLDSEWPINKRAFEEWLSAENFDEDGIQKQKLVDIRSGLLQPVK